RYRVTAWNQRLGKAYAQLLPRFARQALSRTIDALPWPARRYLGRTFLALSMDPRSVFCENFAVFKERVLQEMLADRDALHSRDPVGEVLSYYEGASGGIVDRMSQTDLQTYLVELLMKQD